MICGFGQKQCVAGVVHSTADRRHEEQSAAAAEGGRGGSNTSSSGSASARTRPTGKKKRSVYHSSPAKGGSGGGSAQLERASPRSERATGKAKDAHRNDHTVVMYRGICLGGSKACGHGSQGSRVAERNHGGGFHSKTRGKKERRSATENANVQPTPQTLHSYTQSQYRVRRKEQHQADLEVRESERRWWLSEEVDRQTQTQQRAHAIRNARA